MMKFSILSSVLLASAITQVQAQHRMRRASGIVGAGRDLEEFDGVSLSMSMPAELASVEFFATPTSSPVKLSKSSKTSVCDNRLFLFKEALADTEFDTGLTDEEINDLCQYQPDGHLPELPEGPNFGCPLGYVPEPGGGLWSQGKLAFWNKVLVVPENIVAYHAFEMYCECHVGIQDGCDAKIPREPGTKKWTEYCKAAAVWNGDALFEDTELTKEVEECGCYFIGQMQDKIDLCPGVNLGEFFCVNPEVAAFCE